MKNEKRKLLKQKKAIVAGLIIGSVGLSLFGHKDREYNPIYTINQEYNDDMVPFGSYRYGDVYIIKEDELNKVKKIVTVNDIIVVDARYRNNPDMIVINSSYIWDKDVIDDVLHILLEYENMFPSQWDRNIESLRNEWIMHNIAYKLGINTSDTLSADLDNEENMYFDHKVLTKLLRN
ncbi:MAG: hypothetical protein ACI4WW_04600 [Candidatus Coprovivens sp.]